MGNSEMKKINFQPLYFLFNSLLFKGHIKGYIEFEKSMIDLNKVCKATETQFEEAFEKAEKIAKETGVSISCAAGIVTHDLLNKDKITQEG